MSRNVRGACALYYSYQVKGADGRIKVPFRKRICHSFVNPYIRLLYLKMVGATTQSITDTGGVSRSINVFGQVRGDSTATTSTFGLVVGTGTNAESFSDTALQTQIAHGTTAGTLDYGASVVNQASSDSTSTTMICTRVFANSSGGSIAVTEIGVYWQIVDSGSTNRQFCIARDLATIALLNGDQLTLNYIFKTTS